MLLNLPPELIHSILVLLNPGDLRNLILTCTQLRVLLDHPDYWRTTTVRSSRLKIGCCAEFVEIPRFQGILNLDLSGLISTSPENWEYVLARLSADFHRLKNLKLRNNNFTKVRLKITPPTLETLDLSFSVLTPTQLDTVWGSLLNLRKMRILRLDYLEIFSPETWETSDMEIFSCETRETSNLEIFSCETRETSNLEIFFPETWETSKTYNKLTSSHIAKALKQ
ncbi:uncharacterized protein LOC111698934 isoform X2 [Eurytemora carolleeae]|uniref:uncharacterized protein LOC111698934 isoform X1 n=1 Tax=Eurytemora carolleeae TaxID=1294199 RepID=UPI000C77BD93|nr:uncharacterized protein LOC111698934 isoform X1 [Eurytemora carolleeae]XP_023325184.1 uncharacterized protein LOC111698934 isoform X2 [Eurytemora carolleeae]|eukprot:XP_023325183.1 uncharacterized protein LOC111698934 isoform X1 [Eurytemora affinis]